MSMSGNKIKELLKEYGAEGYICTTHIGELKKSIHNNETLESAITKLVENNSSLIIKSCNQDIYVISDKIISLLQSE
ncbi:MAG: uncharacterized membrane-anchored protein YjiN (DUF445 family) [Candidatus Deianiraeaceae bacterium]|jgi:uncharacterized membrane-anchored protein YjiN (DUF445 family)